jgi:hypothetical protein
MHEHAFIVYNTLEVWVVVSSVWVDDVILSRLQL